MVATGFIFFMAILFFTSFLLTVPSIIGLIVCRRYKKKKGKKAKLIIRILLIIILLAGLVMFGVPVAFGGMIMYDNYHVAQYKLTLPSVAGRRDLAGVKQLLDRGTDPDQNDGLNYTALTSACSEEGNYDIAKLLIEHKCTVDIEIKEYIDQKDVGYTPLMYAANKEEKYDIVKLLIDNNADVNHKASSDGCTPLIIATKYPNHSNDKIVDILIKNGADVNAADNKGKTALAYACNQPADETSYAIIKNLLENGALINTKTTTLQDLLTLAKQYNVYDGNSGNEYYNKIVSILNEYSTK
ncbi:ankyrin repeat domain-containing protein [Clostridium chromiireducens]|uniref:Ankyrin repeat domain-containing protein n=1 Tax=Clostridium chromiireducens TaxID=225345 RepID=A0A399IMP2_9CLOT|nr:ankyrin repeat domain-containing protein [Clostridium chromiireducens]RII34201.1 ankyrin repeat domain-containing protein [Clostridium chromiireducens]